MVFLNTTNTVLLQKTKGNWQVGQYQNFNSETSRWYQTISSACLSILITMFHLAPCYVQWHITQINDYDNIC